MADKNLFQIQKNIQSLICKAEKVLVVLSRPVDPDCVGTGLACKWWLAQLKKVVDVVSFTPVPSNMSDFPDIHTVKAANSGSFNFASYDLMILIDGSSWSQFFDNNWNKILKTVDNMKLVNLDHHEPDEIQRSIPQRCLNVMTSCTAQLLYDFFIAPGNFTLPPAIAQYLYLALLYDARMFKNEIYPGEYRFAQKLISAGVDHLKAADTNYDMREIDFLVWATAHTKFIADLQLTLLLVDAAAYKELRQKLGDDWMDHDGLYKETIERQISGYNYGIILIDTRDGSIRLNWRTRNFGDNLSIAELARKAAFRAGGHRNAGGGTFKGTIQDAESRLLTEIRNSLAERPKQGKHM